MTRLLIVLSFAFVCGCSGKKTVDFKASSTLQIEIVPEDGKYAFNLGQQNFPLLERHTEILPLAKDLAQALKPMNRVHVHVSWNDAQAVASIMPWGEKPSDEVTKALRRLITLNGPIDDGGSWDKVEVTGGGKGYLVERRK
jgi:hypothetical protein